jgi:uncharacterized membrane protein
MIFAQQTLSASQLMAYELKVSVSDVLAVVAFVLAWLQYRGKKQATEAVRTLKRTILKQRAAQHFDDLTRTATQLSGALRSKNWEEVAELTTRLGGLVASAVGFGSDRLMVAGEKRELELAADAITFIWNAIPVGSDPVADDVVKELMRKCMVIVYAHCCPGKIG